MPFWPFVTSPNAEAAYLHKELMCILEGNSHRLTALLWNTGKKTRTWTCPNSEIGASNALKKTASLLCCLSYRPKRQPDDRQMHALSVRELSFSLCSPRQINITPVSILGGRPLLGLNSAMPVSWHCRLPLTPSCLCVQHSSAGPPPVKQMAGNNTVTHIDR